MTGEDGRTPHPLLEDRSDPILEEWMTSTQIPHKKESTMKNHKSVVKAEIVVDKAVEGKSVRGHLVLTHDREIKGIGQIQFVTVQRNYCSFAGIPGGISVTIRTGGFGLIPTLNGALVASSIFGEAKNIVVMSWFHRKVLWTISTETHGHAAILTTKQTIAEIVTGKKYDGKPVAKVTDTKEAVRREKKNPPKAKVAADAKKEAAA